MSVIGSCDESVRTTSASGSAGLRRATLLVDGGCDVQAVGIVGKTPTPPPIPLFRVPPFMVATKGMFVHAGVLLSSGFFSSPLRRKASIVVVG